MSPEVSLPLWPICDHLEPHALSHCCWQPGSFLDFSKQKLFKDSCPLMVPGQG